MRSLFALNASLLCVLIYSKLHIHYRVSCRERKNATVIQCWNAEFHPKWLCECQISSNFWNSIAFATTAFINPFQQIACRSLCLHHHMHIWLFSWQAICIRIMLYSVWFIAFLAYLLNSRFRLYQEKRGKKYCMSRYLSCFMTWFMHKYVSRQKTTSWSWC